jgi:hypothetical protein
MIFAADSRRQPRVCARLAEDCEDQHLAARLRLMAVDLAAKGGRRRGIGHRAAKTPQAAFGRANTPSGCGWSDSHLTRTGAAQQISGWL